jgi:hypothetical protein
VEVKYYQRKNKYGRISNYAEFNGIEFVRNRGYFINRTYGKLHRYIYEYENDCKIPEGYDIHHKDFNKLNNNIDNLEMLTKPEHTKLHFMGKPSQIKGKPKSEEHKQKISEAFKGEKHPMYGQHHSEEARKKISEGLKKQRTHEMYEDIKNKMYYKDFCTKYNVSGSFYYSIKNELKQIKAD